MSISKICTLLNSIYLFFSCFFLHFALSASTNETKKLPQTIFFETISNKTCRDSIFTLNATVSSGLNISYKLLFGKAKIEANSISILGRGSIRIEAFQEGNEQYEPVSAVQQFEVSSIFSDRFNPKWSYTKQQICQGESIGAFFTSISGVSVSWSGPNNFKSNSNKFTISNATILNSGRYTLAINEAKCQIWFDHFNVTVNPNPVVTILGTVPEMSIEEKAIELTGLPLGGKFSGKGISNTLFTPSVAGIGIDTIIYNYTDANNCKGKAQIQIKVKPTLEPEPKPDPDPKPEPEPDPEPEPKKEITVYELISTKPESLHKYWIIENIEKFPENEVFIYDSWGTLVYNKVNYSNNDFWKAEGMAPGIYFYTLKLNKSTFRQGTLYIQN